VGWMDLSVVRRAFWFGILLSTLATLSFITFLCLFYGWSHSWAKWNLFCLLSTWIICLVMTFLLVGREVALVALMAVSGGVNLLIMPSLRLLLSIRPLGLAMEYLVLGVAVGVFYSLVVMETVVERVLSCFAGTHTATGAHFSLVNAADPRMVGFNPISLHPQAVDGLPHLVKFFTQVQTIFFPRCQITQFPCLYPVACCGGKAELREILDCSV